MNKSNFSFDFDNLDPNMISEHGGAGNICIPVNKDTAGFINAMRQGSWVMDNFNRLMIVLGIAIVSLSIYVFLVNNKPNQDKRIIIFGVINLFSMLGFHVYGTMIRFFMSQNWGILIWFFILLLPMFYTINVSLYRLLVTNRDKNDT